MIHHSFLNLDRDPSSSHAREQWHVEHPRVSYLLLSRLWPWPSLTTSKPLNRPRDLRTVASPKRKPVQNLQPCHPAPERDFADERWMMAGKYPVAIECPGILVTGPNHKSIIKHLQLFKVVASCILSLEARGDWGLFWES